MCVIFSCQAICEVNLTRSQFVVSLSGMTVKENDGGVVILQVDNATQNEMWGLIKHLRGNLKKKELLDSKEIKNQIE